MKLNNHFSQKIIILALTAGAFIGFLFLFFYVLAQSPDNPIVSPGSQFQVCTVNDVSQPACYSGDSPTPTFNWTFATTGEYPCPPHTPDCGGGPSSQIAYWVQIDDDGDDNGNYPSPEVNRLATSTDKFFTAPSGLLQFNTTYYWKFSVKDDYGTWSGWACADVPFTTAPPCNNPPTATDLSVTRGDYCTTPAHYFSWTYSDPEGDNQSQFHFQVDNNSNFSSPEIDWVRSGLSNPSPSPNNQTVMVAESPGPDQIAYNTTYWWRVMVWDEGGMASDWIGGSSFTTELHRYPSISFTWAPQEPSAGENVLFTDQSTVYGGATKSSWFWAFEDGNPATSGQQNPTIQFISDGSKQVILQVTDSDGFICPGPRTVNVQITLPWWREILPW